MGYDSANVSQGQGEEWLHGFFIYSAFRHYQFLLSSQHKIRSTDINHSAPGIAVQQSHQDL